jgi:formylmethanofuran dehydrogenase subunit C
VLAAPLIPERLRGLNASAVAGIDLRCGGQTVSVDDLFEVSGAGAEDEGLVLAGELGGFDGIGSGMSRGEIEVRGDVGAWAGAEMSGGVLRVFGCGVASWPSAGGPGAALG